jgi:hypothetical protein
MSKTRCRYDIDKQDTISYRYRLMIRISFLSSLIVSISSHVILSCVDIVWISTHDRFSHPFFIFMSISVFSHVIPSCVDIVDIVSISTHDQFSIISVITAENHREIHCNKLSIFYFIKVEEIVIHNQKKRLAWVTIQVHLSNNSNCLKKSHVLSKISKFEAFILDY